MGFERLVQRFRRILRRGRGTAVRDHPTPEILAAYQANELTAEENAAIQEHFSQCRECSEMLLDLKAFADPSEDETVEITEPRLATAWQRLRARLALESERVCWPPAWLADPRSAQALCACLLAALLGLSAWVAWLHAEMRRLNRPQINVPIVAVDLADPEAKPLAVELSSGAERFLLVVTPPAEGGERPRTFGLELAGEDGRTVWEGGGLRRNDGEKLTLEMACRLLPAGRYRLRLLDLHGGRRAEVAARGFALSYRSPSGKPRLKHPAADGVLEDSGRPGMRTPKER